MKTISSLLKDGLLQFSEAFLDDSSTHARVRYRQQRARNVTRVLKGNPTKTINMALARKKIPLINRVSIPFGYLVFLLQLLWSLACPDTK